MTRHGLQLAHPAITATLDTRTFCRRRRLQSQTLQGCARTTLKHMAPSPEMGTADAARTAARQRSTDTEDPTESNITIGIA